MSEEYIYDEGEETTLDIITEAKTRLSQVDYDIVVIMHRELDNQNMGGKTFVKWYRSKYPKA